MKILVIEDEFEIRDIIKQILIKEGHSVEEAMTGQEGLEKTKEFQPEVIITDLKMPDMDGYHMLFDLIHNIGIDVKVIVVSAYFAPHHIEMCKRLGVDIFIKKPFTANEILEAIKK